jgi:hypothetical protein
MSCSNNIISQPSLDISLSWFSLINKRVPLVREAFSYHTYERQMLSRRFLDTPLEGVDRVYLTLKKLFYCFSVLCDEILSFNRENISAFIWLRFFMENYMCYSRDSDNLSLTYELYDWFIYIANFLSQIFSFT